MVVHNTVFFEDNLGLRFEILQKKKKKFSEK